MQNPDKFSVLLDNIKYKIADTFKGVRNFVSERDKKSKERLDENATLGPMGRSQFVGMVFLGGFIAISIKLGYITFTRHVNIDKVSASAEAEKYQNRADIVDRKGNLLATSLDSYSLYANPQQIWDPKEAAHVLVGVFPDLDEAELVKKLSTDKQFVWIKRKLSPQQKEKVWELGQPGLDFALEKKRVYPLINLAGHILGGVNVDGKGIAGVESALEGVILTSDKDYNVRLSIDSGVQYIVEKELDAAARKFNALNGAAVIMNVRTGEIVASASWPEVNPNEFGKEKPYDRLNRVISSVYEMGSTFKAFTFAVALNDSVISPNSTFDVSHPIKIGGFTISDHEKFSRPLSVREVMEYSSNIGASTVARRVGPERLKQFFDQIGLLKPTSGEILGGAAPLLPSRWGITQSMTASFGHGIAVTPLAVVTAYSAIANGGVYIRPTFLAKSPNDQVSGQRVISKEAAKETMDLLRDVVTSGTGTGAETQYYQVAGKTGTAEKATKYGYDRNRNVASFAGVFPAVNPQYSILFLLDEPKNSYGGGLTGGVASAPSVSKIVSRAAPILGIMPGQNIVRIHNDDDRTGIVVGKD